MIRHHHHLKNEFTVYFCICTNRAIKTQKISRTDISHHTLFDKLTLQPASQNKTTENVDLIM